MAGGEVLKCFVRGGQNFSTCFVCVGGGGGGVSFSTSPSVKKNPRPPPINEWLVPITKSPKGYYVAYLFLNILLVSTEPGKGHASFIF